MIKYFTDIFTAVSTITGGMFITLTHLIGAKKGIATLQYPEERWPRPERGSGFEDSIHVFKRSIYFFAVLSALLTLILGLGMARQVTSPIKRLVTAAREIGRGNLAQADDTSARDEIGRIFGRVPPHPTRSLVTVVATFWGWFPGRLDAFANA